MTRRKRRQARQEKTAARIGAAAARAATQLLPGPKRARRVRPVPAARFPEAKLSDRHGFPLRRDIKQLPLIKRNEVRTATQRALVGGAEQSRRRRQALRNDLALREAICGDYKRDREARRRTLFGSGKSGANPGPRKTDWRAEFCR